MIHPQKSTLLDIPASALTSCDGRKRYLQIRREGEVKSIINIYYLFKFTFKKVKI